MFFLEQLKQIFISDLGVKKEILGNTIEQYLIALGIFIGLSILFFVVQKFAIWRLKKIAERTKTDIDDALIEMVRSIKPPFYYFLAFFIAIQFISLVPLASKVVETILILWAVYQVVVAIQILLQFLIDKKIDKTQDEQTKAAFRYIGRIVKWLLWVMGLLLALSNLGIEITSLVAGLGIGGLAVAFALQNILGDLFGSFVVFFDRPFAVGDFIESGQHMGTVRRVGIKTTRLQSLEGPELVVSNSDITSTRVKNYGQIEQLRAVIPFGVLYETPSDKLEAIPGIVEEIVKESERNIFERANFKEFGESALLFEASFYVKTEIYNEYMDEKERVNFEIKKRLEERGIGFAYPTHTVYMAGKEGE